MVARAVKKEYSALEVIKRRDLPKELREFARNSVYIGIAADDPKNSRGSGGIGNAALGWIHEKGTEHIPPRPFLLPTINQEKRDISKRLGIALKAAIDGKPEKGEKILEGLALTVPDKVREYIRDSSHFEALKKSTIKNRHYHRGTKQHNSENPNSVLFDVKDHKPLIDTGQLMRSIDGFVEKDGKK